jgi:DNA-binding ferritin-like protein
MKEELLKNRKSDSGKKRSAVTGLLQDRLEDAIDLMMQARQAHLNVRRKNVSSWQQLFGKVYADTVVYVDIIAERIDRLENNEKGTVRSAAEKSGLSDHPVGVSSSQKDVTDLVYTLACFGELIRESIGHCTKLGDIDTAEIFMRVSRGVGMNLWFASRRVSSNNGARESRNRMWLPKHESPNPHDQKTTKVRLSR